MRPYFTCVLTLGLAWVIVVTIVATTRGNEAAVGGVDQPIASSNATADSSPNAVSSDARGRGRGHRGPPWAGTSWGGGRGAWQGRGNRESVAGAEDDRDVVHYLLDNHKQIHRSMIQREDGVETVTESDDPEVAKAVQKHVAAMHRRVQASQPIRMRDPLFAAIFAHASQIAMEVENTKKGARVVETSKDPFTVRLIQMHAKVVSNFVDTGHREARQNHDVPR
jgi:uncharacterized protein